MTEREQCVPFPAPTSGVFWLTTSISSSRGSDASSGLYVQLHAHAQTQTPHDKIINKNSISLKQE